MSVRSVLMMSLLPLIHDDPDACALYWLQDVQVYCYYRDLINFKNRGDPAMMLRCINPQEAKLLDAAAGIHVKFRLAGVGWKDNQCRTPCFFKTCSCVCTNYIRLTL